MKLVGRGLACGKIILIGEHAVVYNKPAIAFPFNGLETRVEIFETNDEITIDSIYCNDYLNECPNNLYGIKELVKYLFKTFNMNPFGIHIKITSNNVSERGLGSSAAVSVAVVRAFYDYLKETLSDDELIKHAMMAEKIHHTNPSGLDVYTIVYNKPIWFVRNEGFKVIDLNFEGSILVIDSGMMGQTKKAVEHVAFLHKTKQEKTVNTFNKIEELTKNALYQLENNLVEELEDTINKSQECLVNLEVSNDLLNNIITKVHKMNVKGIKLTGGGMGGCLIAVIKNKMDALKIKNELLQDGIHNVWIHHVK